MYLPIILSCSIWGAVGTKRLLNFQHVHVQLWACSCWTFNMLMLNLQHVHVQLWACSCWTFSMFTCWTFSMCMLMNINMFPNKEIIFFWIFHIQIWTLPNLWLKFISKFGLYQIFGQIHVQIWILPNLWLKIFITSQNENFLKAEKKLVLYFYLNQKLFLFFFNCLMKIFYLII